MNDEACNCGCTAPAAVTEEACGCGCECCSTDSPDTAGQEPVA